MQKREGSWRYQFQHDSLPTSIKFPFQGLLVFGEFFGRPNFPDESFAADGTGPHDV